MTLPLPPRRSPSPLPAFALALLAAFAPAPALVAAEGPESFDALDRSYGGQVRPLMARFCLGCHSTKEKAGDLDLEAFAKLDEVRKAPGTWRKVAEQLASGEMPPKDEDQPAAAERDALKGWVARYLKAEAYANAGDPGPVVLRRLNNAQYAYTLVDLTGHDYRPTRDLPADSAAGEGFTNTGDALVMSPALLGKYLDAAKRVAAHAVLLPDGFRFANGDTRRDWTEEILGSIRAIYARHADAEGKVPLGKYLAAAFEARTRDAGARRELAARRGLNPRYLESLSRILDGGPPSPILDPIRARWKSAGPADLPPLIAEIEGWRNALTRFQTVGHMKPWMVPVDPVVDREPIRLKLPESPKGREVVVHLAAGGAGPGRPGLVVWENLRLARPGRPEIALRDVRAIAQGMAARHAKVVDSVVPCLAAAAEALAMKGGVDRDALSKKHKVDPAILGAWLDTLGIGTGRSPGLDLFTGRLTKAGGQDAAAGWGSNETPLVVANSSDETLHIPGELKGRGVVVHPSPTLRAGAAWTCPKAGDYRVEARVQHAHPACGNGTTWRLELRRGAVQISLAEGATAGPGVVPAGPFGPFPMGAGDLIALTIGPRDGNHACDLTAVDLVVKADGDGGRAWDMAREVSGDALAANPHADASGNPGVWRFFREPDGEPSGLSIPASSTLARWLDAPGEAGKEYLATKLRRLLADGPAGASLADAALYRKLTTPGGPMIPATPSGRPVLDESPWGLPPKAFGPGAVADGIAPADMAVRGPHSIAVRIPAELAAGAELVGSVVLRPVEGGAEVAQARASIGAPPAADGLRPDAPALASGPAARERLKRAFDEFRAWFPAAVCYAKIVPVDEVVTLTLFHREDEPLRRLMLDPDEAARLDRLWTELHFVSRDALTQVEAFTHLMEYATQDGDPRLFEPYRKPIHEHAEAFRKELLAAEPRHLEALVAFAPLAYRRPLAGREARELRELYGRLRSEELPHEEAFALTLARVLASPAFLYRLEASPPGVKSAPATDWEMASRLSYFLTSSAPDAELREAAAAGKLRDPDELAAQARRLLKSPKARRLAEEFACQWVHIYKFDAIDEKSERHFPAFKGLKGAMYEEAILFFADLFQSDAPVRALYDADFTFLNQALAEHYGIPGVAGPGWRRVDGVRKYGRGGLLGLSATLAKQAGASRTSPILRGNWVTEVLLGERVPKPPKNVPLLPEDEASGGGLSVRQLVERHSRDVKCSGCHAKMDPYGFSLEAYDAIGRRREKDAAGLPIDARARLADGTEFDGLDGLRNLLLGSRRPDVERQFVKKLLGYALGRGLMLTDEPLLDDIRRRLDAEGGKISTAVDAIVRSRAFREVRGASPAMADVH
ncbi:hypothetical protein OJF2_29670 [Aquisphaera giovannonii]|uniref:Planctomycete cytochrome C n=1 Tax=Aquisphaera giovannonii TaxID=406548 RepID=A0A5B9W1M5_9BACT|nr:DUF1592 domain-containing protein [Aquisphaera giovannonii]QEH34428.1 hypothetical protein OJF2_29670 [Aquisphaera giovannonii]